MARHIVTPILLFGWLFVADIAAVRAQTAPVATKQDTPANIQASIIKTIGAEENTVEVTSSGGILIVARVNSNMNASTHAGRDNEAKVIGSLVAKRIADEPEFKKVVTIRVEYSVRSAPKAKSKVVDSVEFRKGQDGVFDFHQT